MESSANTIELTDREVEILRILSVDTGKTLQEIVRDAIENYQSQLGAARHDNPPTETLFDALNRQGLIGCLSGGPSDLSTNPIHMEGFGLD